MEQDGGGVLDQARAKAAAAAASAKAAAAGAASKAKDAAAGAASKAAGAAKSAASTVSAGTKALGEKAQAAAKQASMLASITAFMSSIPGKLAAAGTWAKNGVTGGPLEAPASSTQKLVMRGALALLIVGLLSLIGYFIYKKVKDSKKEQSAATDNQPAIATFTDYGRSGNSGNSGIEGFQAVPATEEAPSEDTTLLNTQQLAIKQAGYLGPLTDGFFASDEATAKALKAGFRSLVLQIDYLELDKGKDWAEAGKPTLVWKDDTGAIVSKNSGTISGVAETIAAMGFDGSTPNASQPILLYLHFLRAPSPIQESARYLRYLSQVAVALKPLAPFHLGLTPSGSFHRQALERELLMLPLSAMENKVIIATNADTSMFRLTGKMGSAATRYNPDEDLDFWVNMRVYLEDERSVLGITQAAPSGKGVAFATNFETVAALTDAQATNFAMKGKERFVIAMPKWEVNPTFQELSWALNRAGVNMVPLDIFSTGEYSEIQKLGELYGKKAYRPKPIAMRNLR